MKKALVLLLVATTVGIGLRYVFPKEFVLPKQKAPLIDDFLAATLNEEGIKEKNREDKSATFSPTTKITETKKEEKIEATLQENKAVENATINLHHLYKKLSNLEDKKEGQVRIAYFGDSMLDADMLVMQFRHYIQRRFGGSGVGFVPITSPSASGRYSVKHSFSNTWSKQTFLKKNDRKFPYGIIGETFFVGDSMNCNKATVSYKRGTAYKELNLANPQLFYGKRLIYDSLELIDAICTVDIGEGEEILPLDSNNELNAASLPNNPKSIKITLEDQGTIPLYGISFASRQGVIVDNLAVRGNSGLPLTRLQSRLMRQFDKHFGYDIIILSYGTNVFSPDYKGYAWYGKRMQKVVKHLKKCFPKAEVIIVSMADRAMKNEDVMQTPPELEHFIQVQKSIADATGSAFFNLYESMGGAGSMIRWAEEEPSLANKDYTHFNSRGAEKAAKLFYKWLIKSYEEYLSKQKEEIIRDEENEMSKTYTKTTAL